MSIVWNHLPFAVRARTDPGTRRRGTATLELALCLPILVLLFLGTVDACRLISTRQFLYLAACQGARLAAEPWADRQQVIAGCQGFLDEHRIRGPVEIETVPADVASAEPGEPVSVHIRLDASDLCYLLDSGQNKYEITVSFTVLRPLSPSSRPGVLLPGTVSWQD